MRYPEERQAKDYATPDDAFQRKISPILVLLFSSLLLWKFGCMSLLTAGILLNCSMVYPIYRVFEQRSFEELGIKTHGLKKDITHNWYLIVIPVVVVSPIAAIAAWLYPLFPEHIINRVPIDLNANPLLVFMLVVIVVPFTEEILFRGFLQRYTAFFAPNNAAIIFTSVIFTLFHYAAGDFLAMTLDLLFLFIRGCIYGLIYSKSQNALISFLAHSLVNLPFW